VQLAVIVEETKRALLRPRNRDRYHCRLEDVQQFLDDLARTAQFFLDVPQVPAVTRDPSDDRVIACGRRSGRLSGHGRRRPAGASRAPGHPDRHAAAISRSARRLDHRLTSPVGAEVRADRSSSDHRSPWFLIESLTAVRAQAYALAPLGAEQEPTRCFSSVVPGLKWATKPCSRMV
jgi:hypothetical protein